MSLTSIQVYDIDRKFILRYTRGEVQDYPSMVQVVKAMEEKSITPIFAVGSTYFGLYKVCDVFVESFSFLNFLTHVVEARNN